MPTEMQVRTGLSGDEWYEGHFLVVVAVADEQLQTQQKET